MSSPVPVESPAEVRGWAQRLYAEFVALAQVGFREHQALAIVAALAREGREVMRESEHQQVIQEYVQGTLRSVFGDEQETSGPVDIIDRIDALTEVCGREQCGRPLDPDGPSLDFCSQECQEAWHAAQVVPLGGHADPAGGWHMDPARAVSTGTVEIGWALSSRVEARCADCGVGLPDACDDAPAAVSWPREGMAVGDALAEPFSDHPDYRPEWRL